YGLCGTPGAGARRIRAGRAADRARQDVDAVDVLLVPGVLVPPLRFRPCTLPLYPSRPGPGTASNRSSVRTDSALSVCRIYAGLPFAGVRRPYRSSVPAEEMRARAIALPLVRNSTSRGARAIMAAQRATSS